MQKLSKIFGQSVEPRWIVQLISNLKPEGTRNLHDLPGSPISLIE
jgi:hypothetical protein